MKNDVYSKPEIIKVGNAVIRVYSPIIDEKERERRMNLIKQSSISMVLSKGENK
jgi:hypothetical protein